MSTIVVMHPRRTVRIRDLEQSNRPRERLLDEGPQALTDGELLAILLGSGTKEMNAIQLGETLIAEAGGLSGLERTSLAELCKKPGMGLAKAARIKAALALGDRLASRGKEGRQTIRTPEDLVRLFGRELARLEREELWVVRVNARNHVLGRERLYRGSQDASTARVAELFQQAAVLKAHGIFILHNHPSGDAQESPEDLSFTRSVIEAGKILDIRVLDHIVIAGQSYRSLKRNHPDLWL